MILTIRQVPEWHKKRVLSKGLSCFNIPWDSMAQAHDRADRLRFPVTAFASVEGVINVIHISVLV